MFFFIQIRNLRQRGRRRQDLRNSLPRDQRFVPLPLLKAFECSIAALGGCTQNSGGLGALMHLVEWLAAS